ncbi:MAG: hypothetical protein AAF089_15365 [Bacteroidota bacterium]
MLCLVASAGAPAYGQLRAVGTAVPVVGDASEPFAHPSWSPDGTQLAFSRPSYDGLWVADADGAAPQQITAEAGAGFTAAWAPSGNAIVARVARFEGPRRSDAVKVFDLATAETRTLTDYRASMPTLPRWRADGTVVLVADDEAEALATGLSGIEARQKARTVYAEHPASGLVVLRPDGSRARYLRTERIINAAGSPDTRQVAFEVVGGDLFVMNADGSGLTSLGRGHRPTWSPDGQWVAFMRTQDNGYTFTAADLFAARADGSDIVQLTTSEALEMNPAWSPDGTQIAFDDNAGTIYTLTIDDE